MTDTQETETMFELLYNATAKPLYNLALYTLGDQPTAEKILTDVFVEVFYNISDQSDPDLFMKKSIKLIYRHARRTKINPGYDICITASFEMKEGLQNPDDIKRRQLFYILSRLSFEERYIILLFCWQRFSLKQIAEAICRPEYIVRKRFYAIINKAARVSDAFLIT